MHIIHLDEVHEVKNIDVVQKLEAHARVRKDKPSLEEEVIFVDDAVIAVMIAVVVSTIVWWCCNKGSDHSHKRCKSLQLSWPIVVV